MDKVISMTNIKTKRGRNLGTDEANHKFMQLKIGGSYKGASYDGDEIHERWIDHTDKEFTVVYKEH